MKSDLLFLPNLGPKSVAWLQEAGIQCRSDLEGCGSIEAFLRVEELGVAPSLNLLWSLEGALHDLPWEMIPEEIKQERKADLAVRRNETDER